MNIIKQIENNIKKQLTKDIFEFAVNNSIISKATHRNLLLNCINIISHGMNLYILSSNNQDGFLFYYEFELFRHYNNIPFKLFQ